MSESSHEAEENEAALKAVLASRTSSFQALAAGMSLVAKTAGPGLVILLLYAVGGTIGGAMAGNWGELLVANPPSEDSGFSSVVGGIVAFLAVYVGIQFSKGDAATRQSWWPALLLTPLLCVLGSHSLVGSQFPPQIVPGLALIGWDLFWESFAGAAAVFAWVKFGHGALEGTAASLGDVTADLQKRFLDVAVVHGAKTHAVMIGIQLILPGIFYALSLAFADHIVTLDPERKALRRSSQLTFGMRSRLFQVLLIAYAVMVPVSLATWIMIDGAGESGVSGRLVEFAISPTSPSEAAMFAQRLVGGFGGWVVVMAMLVLYREREGQVAAKRALKKQQSA